MAIAGLVGNRVINAAMLFLLSASNSKFQLGPFFWDRQNILTWQLNYNPPLPYLDLSEPLLLEQCHNDGKLAEG
jgi:hypothetical protein